MRTEQKNRPVVTASWVDAMIVTVSVVITFLALGILFKYRSTWAPLLIAHRNELSVLTQLTTATVVALGGIAAYYRFFKGRAFDARGEVKLAISVHGGHGAENLHIVTIEFKNIGPVPIWNPQAKIVVDTYAESEAGYSVVRNQIPWFEHHATGWDAGILTAEVATFHHTQEISKESLATTYTVAVKSRAGDVWTATATVSNVARERVEASSP